MIQNVTSTNAPDFQTLNDAGFAIENLPPLRIDDRILMPGERLQISTIERPQGPFAVVEVLPISGHGLYVGITADGAREIAKSLLTAAEEIEAHALDMARAAMPDIFQPKDPQP